MSSALHTGQMTYACTSGPNCGLIPAAALRTHSFNAQLPFTRPALIQQIQSRPHHRLRIDLMVLVELGEVAGLAEALHAEAGDR
jgi:hypothetical protein